MSATQAIIHFIGIILFTTQSTMYRDQNFQTQRLQSQAQSQTQIYQRVAITSQRQPMFNNGTKVVAILPRVPASVESHTALISFRACDYIASSGWNLMSLGRDGILYVELNHDTVSFQTSAPNPAINLPATLPLPHLNDSLQSPHNLQAGYTPATGYASAAGVVDMPVGVLSACGINVQEGQPPRIDTEVTLNTNGPLVIVSGSKKLTLKADAHFSIGNVPLGFAKFHQGDNMTMAGHYVAYCAMADGTVSICKPPAITSVSTCMSDAASYKTTEVIVDPLPAHAMSFQCSNTQYP